MKIGCVLPHNEIGTDPLVIRDFAQAVEALGFDHMLLYDHVLGADPDRPGGWKGVYDKDTPFHEPFVTFGYLAACTERIEMVTTVLVVSQRQTALVAKQAAQVDVLSGGRLRLGVGTGWNEIEYEALGVEFKTRGARQEEQVRLMRELWTNDAIQFEGRFHTVSGAGINPRPTRPIPIWFGGGADVVLDRCARLGDGWMPLGSPNDKSKVMVDTLRAALERAGREPDGFGIQAQAQARGGNPDRWRDHAKAWSGLGATHLAIATMNAGFQSIDEHVGAMRAYREAVQ